MSVIENFLTKKEEQEVVNAIQQAEGETSGEIRVHLELEVYGNVHERALEIFHMLEMNNTNLHNGVLFYVAVKSKAFAIYGDKGIHKVVPDLFWETTKDIVIDNFKKGLYKDGIVKGILKAGKELKKYFPRVNNDRNELSDQISKG
jgi:uncharacterized membrane protein|tara:strand:+ start:272 stop:709 length:438 start_codon:yes stop_codon:yes gene_type:complete